MPNNVLPVDLLNEAVSSEPNFKELSVIADRGTGLNTATEFDSDLATMSPNQLITKYGDEVQPYIQRMGAANTRTSTDVSANRSTGQLASDLLKQGVLGATTIFSGGVNLLYRGTGQNYLADRYAQANKKFTDKLSNSRSFSATRKSELSNIEGELLSRDNQAIYDEEKAANPDSIVPDLRDYGRSVTSQLGRIITDQQALENIVAEGVGSLLPISGMTNIAQAGVKALTARLGNKTEPSKIKSALGVIATTESGSINMSTYNQVLDMSHEQLLETSPEYKKLINEGVSLNEAKNRIARDAATIAGGIQLPASLLIAKATNVAPFETAPFKMKGVVDGVSNITRETTEELAQATSGQFAENIGIANIADETRRASDDLGRASAEGIVGGFGAASATQGGGIILRGSAYGAIKGTKAVLWGTGKVAGGAFNLLDKMASNREELAAKKAGIDDETIVGAAKTASDNISKVATDLDAQLDAMPITDEEKAKAKQDVANVLETFSFDVQTEVIDQNFPESIQKILEGTTNRVEALVKLSRMLNDKTVSKEDAEIVAAYIDQMIEGVNQGILEDNVILENLPDSISKQLLSEFQDITASIANSNTINKGKIKAEEIIESMEPASVTYKSFSTPEGQQAVQRSLLLVERRPDKLDAETIDSIMFHANKGDIQITPSQLNALNTAKALIDSAKKYDDELKAKGTARKQDIVSYEIKSEEDGGSKGPSVLQHTKDYIKAVKSGNTELAKTILDRFGSFVQSMNNKVEAVNKNYELGATKKTRQRYQTVNPTTGKWYTSKEFMGITLDNEGSVQFVNNLAAEAAFVTNVFNNIIASSGLDIKPIKNIQLAKDISGNAAEIAAKNTKQKPEKTAETSKETVDPKPEKTIESEVTDPDNIETEATVEAVEPVSRITPIQATELSNLSLDSRVNILIDKLADNIATDVDKATLAVLEDEQSKRENEPKEITKISEAYSGLQGTEKNPNNFLSSFKLAKNKSKLVGQNNPISYLIGLIKQNTKATPSTIKAYLQIFNVAKDIKGRLNLQLQEALDRPYSKTDKRTFRELLDSGEMKINQFKARLPFNLIVKTDDGYAYNDSAIEAAVLAAMQWYIDSNNTVRKLEAEDIAKIMKVPVFEVTPTDIAAFNSGLSALDIKDSLGNVIKNYLGVTADPNAPDFFTLGIPQSLAAELTRAMVDQQMITKSETFKLSNGNDLIRYLPNVIDKDNVINSYPNLIDELSLNERDPVYVINNETPIVTAKTQLHKSNIPLTTHQQNSVEKNNEIEFYVDPIMADTMLALGAENNTILFGSGIIDPKVTNDKDLVRMKGVNLSITGAFAELNKMVQNIKATAKRVNKEINETPIKFPHGVTSIGRLQMQGAYNPVSSKLVREALVSTRSIVNLKDPTSIHLKYYMLALAQALDVKIHNQDAETSIKDVMNKLENDLMPAIKIMQEFLKSNRKEITKENAYKIKSIFDNAGIPLIPVALHAITDFANLLNQDPNTLDKYETSVYIEADGVTNGPANIMGAYGIGIMYAEEVERLNKVGFYFGSDIGSLAEHKKLDANDLYKSGSDLLTKILSTIKNTAKETNNTKVISQLDAISVVMGSLFKDAEFDGETLTLGRSIFKNPLTITIYGSGAAGIAGNFTSAIEEVLTKNYTNILVGRNNNSELSDDQLFLNRSDLTKEEATKEVNKIFKAIQYLSFGTKDFKELTYKNYEFTKEQKANISKNILFGLINPMVSAIGGTVGNKVIQVAETIRKATQIQSIFAKHTFNNLMEKKLKEKKEKGEIQSLSQNELKEIYKQIQFLYPNIETSYQVFNPGSRNRTDLNNGNDYGRALDGSMATPPSVFAPDDAGVGGIPMLIVGTGDALMMQFYFNDPTANTKEVLAVYDGMHMSLNNIENVSPKINEAVHKTWMENTLQTLADNFNKFYDTLDDTNLSFNNTMTDELIRAFGVKKEDGFSKNDFIELKDTLNNMALERQARVNTLKQMKLTVDQMASVGLPFVSEGIEANSDQMIDMYNNYYRKEYARLTKTEPKEVTNTDLKAVSEPTNSGASVISPDGVKKLFRNLKLTDEQKEVYKQIVRNLPKDAEYIVVTGTADQIIQYAKDNNEYIPQIDVNTNGFINPNTNTIYLVNPTIETLSHELIHLGTFNTILAYFRGEKLSPQVTKAIQNIELMMEQFLELGSTELAALTGKPKKAYEDAIASINSALTESTDLAMNRAKAVNEFMAWGLTNKDLVDIGKRTKVTKFAEFVKGIISSIKQMFWGKERAPKVGNDVFSNLLFNSSIVSIAQTTIGKQFSDTVLYHSIAYGTDVRLEKLNEALKQKVIDLLPSNKIDKAIENRRLVVQSEKIREIGESAVANGFPMTLQESTTFDLILQVLFVSADIDPASLQKAQEVFTHVMDNITVESFMDNPELDNPNDRKQAQDKYSFITGNVIKNTDDKGRSSILPVFMALAVTNANLRKVLSKVSKPKTPKSQEKNIDGILENIAYNSMDFIGEKLSGINSKDKTALQALDALTDEIYRVTQARKSFMSTVTSPVGNLVNAANDLVLKGLNSLSEASTKVNEKAQESENKTIQLGGKVTELIGSLVNEQKSEAVAMGLMSQINTLNVWGPLRKFVGELVGRTKENKEVYGMIKIVKSHVQRWRQEFVKEVPKIIESKFKKPLNELQRKAMYVGLGQTDLASLFGSFNVEQIFNMLRDGKTITNEINNLEAKIQKRDPKLFKEYQSKANELADFMVNGIVGSTLLQKNAYAIAQRFGIEKDKNWVNKDNDFVNMIDQYVSLLALNKTDKATKDNLKNLVETEREGVNFVFAYLRGQRVEEIRKANSTDVAKANYHKGYIPLDNTEGAQLVIDTLANEVEMRKRGYVPVGKYIGSTLDTNKASRQYYYSSVPSKASMNQGIMQYIRNTASGVDPLTGYSVTGKTAGVITDPTEVIRITKELAKEKGNEKLTPVFSADGFIVAYERSMNQDMLNKLNPEKNISNVLGVWKGRQVEEFNAHIVNEKLIDNVKDMWDEGKAKGKTGEAEFVDVFDPAYLKKNPIVADAVKLLTPESMDHIKKTFGNQFMIRKDMLDDVLGYRSASIGDFWTENSNFNPKINKQMQTILTAAIGLDAYKYLTNTERFVQNLVYDAKLLIVVKSMIIPAVNTLSNIYHKLSIGVTLEDMTKGYPAKLNEINFYVEGRKKQIELQADLRLARGNTIQERKIRAELQSITDSFKRLTIWSLIEAGEFTSISDSIVTNGERLLYRGNLYQYFDNLTNSLPEGIKQAGKYALITQDTALFKGLQKAVDYGDFISKAILFDHLTKNKKLSKADALGRVTEEFVNYDRLPGRFRGYLEGMGMLWFYNFKIRSTKIAVSMLRNNPVHVLFMGLFPRPEMFGYPGLPTEDSLIPKILENELGYSIGPGQGIRAINLHPWVNLTD